MKADDPAALSAAQGTERKRRVGLWGADTDARRATSHAGPEGAAGTRRLCEGAVYHASIGRLSMTPL